MLKVINGKSLLYDWMTLLCIFCIQKTIWRKSIGSYKSNTMGFSWDSLASCGMLIGDFKASPFTAAGTSRPDVQRRPPWELRNNLTNTQTPASVSVKTKDWHHLWIMDVLFVICKYVQKKGGEDAPFHPPHYGWAWTYNPRWRWNWCWTMILNLQIIFQKKS